MIFAIDYTLPSNSSARSDCDGELPSVLPWYANQVLDVVVYDLLARMRRCGL